MLKKYLNCNNAQDAFLNFSLLIILVYSTSLAMYLAMPPEGVPSYFVFELGFVYLENVLCALSVTGLGNLLIKYICKCNK